MMRPSNLCAQLCLAMLAASAATPLAAAEDGARTADPQLAAASARYESASWPKGDLRPGFELGRLAFAGYRGDEIEVSEGQEITRRYLDGADRTRFLIELAVQDSVAQAHESLLTYIAFVSSTKTLPTAASAGIPVGDIGYVGFSGAGEGRIAWLALVRGNICARLVCLDASGDLYPDMPALARTLDDGLKAVPALAPGAAVPHPAIGKLGLERPSCTAGDVLRIELRTAEAPAVVTWVLGGPGQGYVEKGKDGAHHLHTTGPGKLTLTAIVTSALGTHSSQSVALEIADD